MKLNFFSIDKEKFFYSKGNPSFLKKIYWKMSPEYRAIAALRFGKVIRKIYNKNKLIGFPLRIVYSCINYPIKTLHKVFISIDSEIGPGFYIVHASNIMIGNAHIGHNCTIHHNVTIGDRVAKRDKGVAHIGNNVWIGVGVIITGNINIGDGAVISSGSVLSKDIPPHSLVAGNPARVLMNDYDSSKFFSYRINTEHLK